MPLVDINNFVQTNEMKSDLMKKLFIFMFIAGLILISIIVFGRINRFPDHKIAMATSEPMAVSITTKNIL